MSDQVNTKEFRDRLKANLPRTLPLALWCSVVRGVTSRTESNLYQIIAKAAIAAYIPGEGTACGLKNRDRVA